MPRLNGTGPNGAGPMTGRGMGYCNNANISAPFYGRGLGIGRGRGFGLSNNYGYNYYSASPLEPEQQKKILNQQKSFLENELKNIDEEINKL